MKRILIFIMCLISTLAHSQAWQGQTVTTQTRNVNGNKQVRFIWLGSQVFNLSDSLATLANQYIPAGPISSTATLGFNPGANITAGQWIQAVFYRSANPTATLTGGGNIRITASATTNSTLTYAYGKQTGTLDIASATINGSATGVTQNVNGASGSYVAAVPTSDFNSVTYTLLVTTTDNKTAASAVTFTKLNDRFAFRSATAVPNAATIQAAAGGSSGLSGSRAGTFVITASGSNYPGFAYPSRLGALTSIKDANNVEVLSGYNTDVVSITTAGGYTETYRYYINQNATSGNTTMVTQ